MATKITESTQREERRRRVAEGDDKVASDSGYGIQGRGIPVVDKPRVPSATPVTSRQRVNSFGEALWDLFCSLRLLMVLLTLLGIATLAGTLIIQMPAELQGDASSRAMWVKGLTPRFGDLTELMANLSLFTVFSTWWFKGLLLLLTLSIIVCTLDRFPKMWKQATSTRMRVGPRFFTHGEYTATVATAATPEQAQAQLAAAMRKRHLTVRLSAGSDDEEASTNGAIALYADRYRYMPLGTYINHLGIVLLFIGAIWGTLLGTNIKIVDFAIPAGSSREVGYGTGLTVRSDGFTEVDYPDGRPADYYSDIVVFENGTQVVAKRIRVNDPLDYKGILFHQAFFGNAADLKVTDDATGQVVYQGSIALAYRSPLYGPNNPMGSFTLANGEITVDVVAAGGPGDTSLRPGQIGVAVFRTTDDRELWRETLSPRQSVSKTGLTFTFLRERQFSGLQVVRDNGVTIVMAASVLMWLGIMLVFYLPTRRLWGRIERGVSGETLIHLKGQAPRRAGLDKDLVLLCQQLVGAGATVQAESEALIERRQMLAEVV